MENKPENRSSLFQSSGCLSEEGIELLVSDRATEQERMVIEKHLSGCEMCSAAAEGYRILMEENPAERPAAIITGLKKQVALRGSGTTEKKYLRPALAIAATLILIVASFIIFRMVYRDKEPVIAKLSQPELIRETIQVKAPAGAIQEIKPEAQTDGGLKTTTNRRMAVSEKVTLETPVAGAYIPREEKSLQEEQLKKNIATESTKEVVINTMGAGTTGGDKSLSFTSEKDAALGNNLSTNVPVSNDTFYLAVNKAYQINASAPASYANENLSMKKTRTKSEDESKYAVLEVFAQYPGGQDSMNRFIKRNLVYPEKAISQHIQGMVNISFYVEKDGKLSGFAVKKSLGYGCDEEALRVVKLMPNWIPASQNGKSVRTQMTVPVKFSLTN